MLLTGTYIRSLDEKLRFAIPRRLRDAIGPEERVLYLAPGTDQSLAMYTEQAFGQLAAQLNCESPTGRDVRAFSRLFYAQAERVEMDRQGRIRLPIELAQLASIEKEIVLLGVRDHVEIWDHRQWQSYLEKMQPRYDTIAESAFAASSEFTAGADVAASSSAPDAPSTKPR
jgi:MraZ protein